MIKIKYAIPFYSGEVRNCWAIVKRLDNNKYALYFDDGISFTGCALFDPNTRTFYNA